MLPTKKQIAFFSLLASFYCSFVFSAIALTPEELRRAIEEKSRSLQQVNAQIESTQQNLNSTNQRSKSLTQEIRSIDYRIRQLNLTIQSSEIKIDKLNLEIQSLQSEVVEKEHTISDKKDAIVVFLRELQKNEHEGTLLIFLKNKSLAESLSETQSINSVNQGLTLEMQRLNDLKADLLQTLDAVSEKKRGVETEHQTLRARKTITQDQKSERQELLASTRNQERVYQERLRELERQQAEIAAEVEQIERELRQRIDPNLLPLARPGVLHWPANSSRLSQGYGQTAFASVTYRGRYHNGVDIAGPIGTEIYAAADGLVVATGNQDRFCPRGAYGKFIVVRHENGLTTLYGHLSQLSVSDNARVSRGQVIGYMGKTGWATGPHLHFTVYSSSTFTMRASRTCGLMPVGGDVNPLEYLERNFSEI